MPRSSRCCPSHRRAPRLLLQAALVALIGTAPAVRAQEKPAPPTAPAANPMTVVMHINDLGLLKAIGPLNLTQGQIDGLLAILKQVAKDAEARVRQDEDVLRALAADVDKARVEALAGGPISTELETRVQKISRDAEQRQRAAKDLAVRRILGVAKTVLTPAQRDLISAQSEKALGGKLVPREFRQDPAKAPKEAVLDLATAKFIEMVLLNDRAIDVLSRMKPKPAAP